MSFNRCIESGCFGYCCWDTNIEVTKTERTRLFPTAVKLKTLKELRGGNLIKGVPYFASLRNKKLGRSGFYEVGWVGPCPNLLSNGYCKKHEERAYAARNFKFGSKECNNVRNEYGLPPVFVEPVE